jgi:RNA polymerase subunit RPABC4/transcription elongation factor Spt4
VKQKPKCPKCGGNDFSVSWDAFIGIVYCENCGHIIGVVTNL